MLLDNNFLMILGGALVLIAIVVVVVRATNASTQTGARPTARGPSDIQFICAGCSQRFAHTRRTVGAWEKGTRRFFCDGCHKSWRTSRPQQKAEAGRQQSPKGEASASAPIPAKLAQANQRAANREVLSNQTSQRARNRSELSNSRSGCLGISIFLIAVPIVLLFAVLQ